MSDSRRVPSVHESIMASTTSGLHSAEVPAEVFAGVVAVHVGWANHAGQWVVTHVASGFRIVSTPNRRLSCRVAREFVRRLPADSPEWREHPVSMEAHERLRDVALGIRAVLGLESDGKVWSKPKAARV
jgi:L-alanine-DL-glutamate epimerase-like enolase superfamily enzyme